jgi:hypothetical protein
MFHIFHRFPIIFSNENLPRPLAPQPAPPWWPPGPAPGAPAAAPRCPAGLAYGGVVDRYPMDDLLLF